MSFLFSSPTPDIPDIPVAPTKNDTSVQDAAKKEAESLRKRKGFLSTIVTGAGGTTTQAPTEKAALLSGSGSYG